MEVTNSLFESDQQEAWNYGAVEEAEKMTVTFRTEDIKKCKILLCKIILISRTLAAVE